LGPYEYKLLLIFSFLCESHVKNDEGEII